MGPTLSINSWKHWSIYVGTINFRHPEDTSVQASAHRDSPRRAAQAHGDSRKGLPTGVRWRIIPLTFRSSDVGLLENG